MATTLAWPGVIPGHDGPLRANLPVTVGMPANIARLPNIKARHDHGHTAPRSRAAPLSPFRPLRPRGPRRPPPLPPAASPARPVLPLGQQLLDLPVVGDVARRVAVLQWGCEGGREATAWVQASPHHGRARGVAMTGAGGRDRTQVPDFLLGMEAGTRIPATPNESH